MQLRPYVSLAQDHKLNPPAKPRVDLTGRRFGRLVVQGDPRSYSSPTGKKRVKWITACDCGELKISVGEKLTSGELKSCGCLGIENQFQRTHGLTKTHAREYASWAAMRNRCDDPSSNGYKYYGGIGVVYVDEWKDFEVFVRDMGRRPDGHTLDRFHPHWKAGDKPLNYGPETCRWATRLQQSANLSSNNNLSLDGRTMPLAQWARELDISRPALLGRINRKWSEQEILRGARDGA